MYNLLVVIYIFCFSIVHASVTTCPNPKSTDSVVKVIVTTIDGSVSGEEDKQVFWLAPDYTTVFLVTTRGTLWRSFDSGRNWGNVTLESNSLGVKFVQLSGDSKSVVVIGYGSHWWTSSPDGKTFTHSIPPGQMEEVKFHPLHSSWLIAIKSCQYNVLGCTSDLYVSQDSGIQWFLLRRNVRKADWNSESVDEKFVIVWEKTPVLQDSHLLYSNDFFQTHEIVVAPQVVGYKTVGKKIFIARPLPKGNLGLQVSEDGGATFHDVRFPGGLKENLYTILDVTEGSTFINVQHDDGASWGNLYSSNALGSDFVLSLKKNVRNAMGKCDFKAIAGLEGIYMANSFASTSGQEETGIDKQTMITYDLGGKWTRLPQPQGILCESTSDDECKLNLLGTSDGNTWYTRKEAIGLVLTTGSPSRYLLNVDNKVGVYMSRDAGWSWKFVTGGRYTYEIGNRGAILLLMTNDHATGTLKYSLDEGDTWSDCVFAAGTDQVQVQEIVSDPNMQSGMFLAYGTQGDKGILISIDFSGIHERDCKGFDSMDDPSKSADSDYEYWEPSDSRGNDCLLGRRMKYIRRKQTAACLNPVTFQNSDAIFVKNCSCTKENYECDYCFVAITDAETGEIQCIQAPECNNYDPKQVPEDCHDTYTETQGYRRVPGDTCDPISGLDLMPIQKDCPSSSIIPNEIQPQEASGRGPLVAFLIIAVLLLLLVGMWIFSGYNDNIRQLLGYVIPKKFLPEFRSKSESSSARYSPVQLGDDDLEEDAPEIDVDKSDSENPGSVI